MFEGSFVAVDHLLCYDSNWELYQEAFFCLLPDIMVCFSAGCDDFDCIDHICLIPLCCLKCKLQSVVIDLLA